MRFEDIVMCVASIAVIFTLILFPLDMVLVSALGLNWIQLSLIVSFFLSALISGYIFAGKLWEARREAITKVSVLWAALNMLIVLITPAGLADWGSKVKEAYQGQYGTTLSTQEWYCWEIMHQDLSMFSTVGLALLLGFIGLYVGSMLRRPVKSGK